MTNNLIINTLGQCVDSDDVSSGTCRSKTDNLNLRTV